MRTPLRQISAAAITLFIVSCGGGGGGTTAPDTTIASVTIAASATTIAPGSSSQWTATARNAAGAALSGMTATWSSSNTSVATVNGSGLVAAVANGTATITATINGVSATKQVIVQAITVSGAATVDAGLGNSFSPAQVDISAGGQVTWNFSTTHNVTFDAATGAPANIGDTPSGSAARTFTTAGSFAYHCTLHAGMNGTVVVH